MVEQEVGEKPDTSQLSDEIRILLVGDQGVGKTSLIYSLVHGKLTQDVPPRLDVTLPCRVNPENVRLHIVDYSKRQNSLEFLKDAIRDSDAICIVYAIGHSNSLDRVATHWIPTIETLKSEDVGNKRYRPIILVANKADLAKADDAGTKVATIFQECTQVEGFIEVSALTQKNVVELFFMAQRAVTYPLAPLFVRQLRTLTKKCHAALINIFKLCDLDRDGLLNDHELNLFQENCFGTPLQEDALHDLKSIIKQSTIDGIVNDGMTQAGFLFLHTLTIDKGRPEFTWRVLKKFNYNDQLDLTQNEDSKQSSDQICDLSRRGSFSSDRSGINSSLKSTTECSDVESENFDHQPDPSWVREHSSIIKAGIGLTTATLISMFALKFLIHGNARSSI